MDSIAFFLIYITFNLFVLGTGVFIVMLVFYLISNMIKSSNFEKDFKGVVGVNPNFARQVFVLSKYILNSDGEEKSIEWDCIERQFMKDFEGGESKELLKKVKEISFTEDEIGKITDSIHVYRTATHRVQLADFLLQICVVDGIFSDVERRSFEKVATGLGLSRRLIDSLYKIHKVNHYEKQEIQHDFKKHLEEVYSVFGLSPKVDFTLVKKQYRELVKIYHPDKLPKDQQYRKTEYEMKFQKIKEAYDMIKIAKGM